MQALELDAGDFPSTSAAGLGDSTVVVDVVDAKKRKSVEVGLTFFASFNEVHLLSYQNLQTNNYVSIYCNFLNAKSSKGGISTSTSG